MQRFPSVPMSLFFLPSSPASCGAPRLLASLTAPETVAATMRRVRTAPPLPCRSVVAPPRPPRAAANETNRCLDRPILGTGLLGSVAGIWTEHAGVLEQRGERRLMKLDAEKCTPYLLDGTGGRLFASSSGLGGRGGGLSDSRGHGRPRGFRAGPRLPPLSLYLLVLAHDESPTPARHACVPVTRLKVPL